MFMKNFLLWSCFVSLIVIHTLDMELTRVFIGDCWEIETFLPMRVSIEHFGIANAIWISRSIMYTAFFVFLTGYENKTIQKIMILGTVLYWVSMIQWLDFFGWFPFNI